MTALSKQLNKIPVADKDASRAPAPVFANDKPYSESTKDYARDKKCACHGNTHKPCSCPALGKTCFKCGKKNHYAKLSGARVANYSKNPRIKAMI